MTSNENSVAVNEGRRRKAKRRTHRAKRAATAEVLDVYGTVTGNGTAVSTEDIKASVFDALR